MGVSIMDISTTFGILAGALNILAFIIYNKQMLQETSRPNSATWALWVFTYTLNASSYIIMSGDLIKSILSITNAVACVLTFIFSLYKGKLSKIDLWDGLTLGIGIIAILVWWHYKSATYANMILQVSSVVSFYPTARGIWKDPTQEKALPWCIWSIDCILNIIAIILRWKGQYSDLAYPTSTLMLNLIACYLASKSNITKNTTTKKELRL